MRIMKRLFFAIAFISTLSLFGQYQLSSSLDNYEILKNKKYKKGLYASIDEFRNNSPSDTSTSIELEKVLPVQQVFEHRKDQEIHYYDDNGNKVSLNKLFWGFCDGEEIYIYSKKMYLEINTLGKFCVFTIEDYKRGSGRYKSIDYFFDIENGEVFELNEKTLVEKVLVHDIELLKKFDKDKMKKSMLHWYLNEVNSKF